LRPYLLSISNRFPWKNYARLVEAFHRALTGFRDEADLVLIGNPVDEAVERNIAGYIREHNLLTRVHILKGLPQTDLPRIYSGARAYVFPSLAESFGMTVLEAMACGVPVAVSNREPLPEICGEAAVYFDPLNTDQMSTCLLAVEGDERLRSSLIQKGIARAHSFTWEHAAEQYLEVLGEVARS
jgi:glycosyltransferase involved in cell wall biosynthesis